MRHNIVRIAANLSLGLSLNILHFLFKVQSLGLELTSEQIRVLHTSHRHKHIYY